MKTGDIGIGRISRNMVIIKQVDNEVLYVDYHIERFGQARMMEVLRSRELHSDFFIPLIERPEM